MNYLCTTTQVRGIITNIDNSTLSHEIARSEIIVPAEQKHFPTAALVLGGVAAAAKLILRK